MRFYEEVRAGRLTNRILQHGRGPSELQEKIWANDPFFALAISRPVNDNGRIVQAGRHVLNFRRQYPSSNSDRNDHKPTGRER